MNSVTKGFSFYDLFMAPLESSYLRDLRSWLVPHAAGEVLEIGAGTGANLPFYNGGAISRLVLTDREVDRPFLARRLRGNQSLRSGLRGDGLASDGDGGPNFRGPPSPAPRSGLSFADADVQDLPFPGGSFDSVVFTLVFCTVPDPGRGLAEIRRVLRPGGRLFFLEHVRPAGPASSRLFDRVTPAWKRMASGCRLNRRTVERIAEAGFAPREIRMRGVFAAGWALRSGVP